MIVVQILLAFVWMCLLPFLTGCIFTKLFCKKNMWSLSFVTVTGITIHYAVYEVLALLFIWKDGSFRTMTKCYAVAAVILSLIGMICIYVNRKNFVKLLPIQKQSRKKVPFKAKWDWFLIAALLMILAQLVAILFWATPDGDDAFYSGLSSMSLANDYILKYTAYAGRMKTHISIRYAISALPVYQASLTLLCGKLHHLFITHNLFPLFYMPLSYGLFYGVGKLFVGNDKSKMHRFLFFFTLLHLFGNFFVFSPQNFLVTRIWQGKALFVCFTVPFVYLAVQAAFAMEERKEKAIFVMLVAAALMAAAFMGETGLFLGPLMLIALIAANLIVKKMEEN